MRTSNFLIYTIEGLPVPFQVKFHSIADPNVDRYKNNFELFFDGEKVLDKKNCDEEAYYRVK